MLDTSRRDTTLKKAAHFGEQLPLGVGSRSWVHRALRLEVAETRPQRALVATIIRERHYLGRWPVPPRTLMLSYLADLGGAGAAAMATIALLPTNYGALLPALGLHPCEVLQLVRCWRADDLGPALAPDLMPEVLRRIVRRLREDWTASKGSRIAARPRLLVTYADTEQGHDGALYLGAGAAALGGTKRLCFAWAADRALRPQLRQYAQAKKDLGS